MGPTPAIDPLNVRTRWRWLAWALPAVLAGGLQAAQTLSPAETARRWVQYGQQAYAQRDYDKAIQAFSQAARLDAPSPAPWKGLGNAFYAKKDRDNALKYHRYALRLNPGDAALADLVARLERVGQLGDQNEYAAAGARRYQDKRYEDAIQLYQKAVGGAPEDAKAWQGLGNSYYALKMRPEAINAYRRSLHFNPNNSALRSFLEAYEAAGDPAPAYAGPGPRQWGQPLWRSLVLPGWGQVYNGETTKGAVLIAGEVLLLGGTLATFALGNEAKLRYEGYGPGASQAAIDEAYDQWGQMAGLNHVANIAWGLLFSYAVIDAIVGAKRADGAQAWMPRPDPALQLGALPRSGALGISLKVADF